MVEEEDHVVDIHMSILTHDRDPDPAEHDPPSTKVKSGPGDYYCSFVPTSSSTSVFISQSSSHLLIIGEAKAPHKLTRDLIPSALGDNNLTIDTRQFIQSTERNQLHTCVSYDEDQKWLAAVATQIYSTLLNHS